jgi:hypothetical protein
VPPAPTAAAPATTEPAAPVAEAPATTAESERAPVWPWVLGGLLVIGAIAALLLRRRRDPMLDQYSAEQDYAYPTAAAEPLAAPSQQDAYAAAPFAAAPLAAAAPAPLAIADPGPTQDDVSVSHADESEVAALTAAAPSIEDRPWLEFAMRPVRAGTTDEEALVEIELTIANAGAVTAEDVRVSTFMLTDAHASEMERMLIDPPADATVAPVTIAPGEGTRIDATLAALKADLGDSNGFNPVVVADARYRLPDGGEGRTLASFVLGRSDDHGGLAPFDLADGRMHDDIEVRLHGTPERV